MPVFTIDRDYARPAHAGALGMYQLMRVLVDEKDVTSHVDQGMLFHEEDEDDKVLTGYLSQQFNIPEKEIEYPSAEASDHPDWPFK